MFTAKPGMEESLDMDMRAMERFATARLIISQRTAVQALVLIGLLLHSGCQPNAGGAEEKTATQRRNPSNNQQPNLPADGDSEHPSAPAAPTPTTGNDSQRGTAGPSTQVSTAPVGVAATLAKWGDQLLEQGNFDGAIVNYDKAIEVDGENVQLRQRAAAAHAGRARNLVMHDQSRPAEQDLRKAIQLDPDHAVLFARGFAEAYFARGQQLYKRWRQTPAEKSILRRALDAFTRATELNMSSVPAFKMCGYCHYALGNLTHALRQFDVVIQAKPDDTAIADVYRLRGTLYLRTHLESRIPSALPLALADLERAVRLHPENVSNRSALAKALAAARQGKRAVEEAIRACELARYEDWQALFALASACFVDRQYDPAVKWASRALQLAPANEKKALRLARDAFQKQQPAGPITRTAANAN